MSTSERRPPPPFFFFWHVGDAHQFDDNFMDTSRSHASIKIFKKGAEMGTILSTYKARNSAPSIIFLSKFVQRKLVEAGPLPINYVLLK